MKKLLIVTALLTASLGPAHAMQCYSVGGQVKGQAIRVAMSRQVWLTGNVMRIMDTDNSGTIALKCIRYERGVNCAHTFTDGGTLTIMTNKNRMFESARTADGSEMLSVSYVCAAP